MLARKEPDSGVLSFLAPHSDSCLGKFGGVEYWGFHDEGVI